jgi:hypothetical protein
MGDLCDLHAANGSVDEDCRSEACPFWRIVEHVSQPPGRGCAIKHFQLLGEEELAIWLLSVRERIERLESEKCPETEG